ncbi:MAG: type II toxin-antitoxin system PemK/MazF family toxin [Terriglobia bacterium]
MWGRRPKSTGWPFYGRVDCSEPTGIARILLIIVSRGPEAALRATPQRGQRRRNKAASVVNPHARCYAVSLTGAGTKTTGVVRCDQPRALDLGARNGRKLENVPDAIMDEVLAKVGTILE